MPFNQPRSLSNREFHSLVAFLLAENKLIGETDEINATTLPKVCMPNHDNFVVRFPDRM
jgi:S-disulfanyl-L-cysteine oxidoreductase SoxD